MDETDFAREALRREIRTREDLRFLASLPREERAAALRGALHREALQAPAPREPANIVHWSQTPDCRRGGNVRRLIMRKASEIAPEPVQWLWQGRLAAGKLTLIGGAAGSGKSNLLANLVATVTSGGLWPCGEGHAPRGQALMLSAEDGERETILPRLVAANAGLERVSILSSVDIAASRRTFSLRVDLDLLENAIRSLPELRLITIDPISSYLGGANGNRNETMRELLDPLAALAAHHRVAVVAVTHPPKGRASDAAGHFIGSIAFNAAARASFFVSPDPRDNDRRLLLQVKNNLATDRGTLAFRIMEREVRPGIVASALTWQPQRVALDISDLVALRGAGNLARLEAEQFLRDLLATGVALPVADIELAARRAGLLRTDQPISQCRSLRDARNGLGVVVKRTGFGGGARYTWALPGRA
jgi:putative DNA primase/helicase